MLKFYPLTLLVACLLVLLCNSQSSDFSVNLRTGLTSALPEGISWSSALTSGSGGCECDRQGLLKLTFSSQRVRAEINMTFEKSEGFTFNVGDSATNNGYAGDSSTQSNDAEIHSVGNSIQFYGRDNPAGGSYGLLYNADNFVAINPYTIVKLSIADQLATVSNGINYIYINSDKLFALNGQSDTGGVNYDVYFAMNRVVGSSFRNGKGLCNVSIRFYNF